MDDKSGHLDQAMRFISITDGTIQRRYPTSAKHYLAQEYGAPFKAVSRVISDQITDQDVSKSNYYNINSLFSFSILIVFKNPSM